MNNRLGIIFSILFLSISGLLPAQDWESVKKDPTLLFGEGWGSSVAEADQNALADLISKISLQVVSTFESHTEETALGSGEVNSEEYIKSKVNTYSQATLNNTQKYVIENEPDAHVGRWIRKSELNRIFENRKHKVKEFVELAIRAEEQCKVDDALRYYYWAFTLVQSLQHPSEEYYTDDAGERHLLTTWIPACMNGIFDDIKVEVSRRMEDNLMLRFTFRGSPVSSLDYTYFDGREWSNIYSAKDGMGILELVPRAAIENPRLKYEYEYRSEAHVDKEVATVLNVVRSRAMRKAYATLDVGSFIGGSIPSPSSAPSSSSLVATDNAHVATNAEASISASSSRLDPPAPLADDAFYRKVMEQVVKSICTRQYTDSSCFTEEGWAMFRKLIAYGNAQLLSDGTECRFYEMGDAVVARSIPMSFSFKTGMRKSFVEDVVFTFNKEKKIESLSFGLGQTAENDILNKGYWPISARMALMAFLENYKTAYALKRLDYIRDLFADDALIIVGSVLKKVAMKRSGDGDVSFAQNDRVKLTRLSKEEYIRNLTRSFKSNEYINLRFSNNDVVRGGKGGEIYGIQIKQDYYSSTYGDTGYLFLLVDINNPKEPIIKVRTWQPERDPDFGLVGIQDF